MKENIVDFNQFKAMKEAKSKNNADDFLPDFPDDMDMEEFDSDSMDSLTGAVRNPGNSLPGSVSWSMRK